MSTNLAVRLMIYLKGGMAGGSILKGGLKVGQEIEVRPGIVSKDCEGKLMCKPIFSKIVSLFAEHNDLQYAAPGGLIGKDFPLIPTLNLRIFVEHFMIKRLLIKIDTDF